MNDDIRKWAEATEVEAYENIHVGMRVTTKDGDSGIITKIIVPKYPEYKDIKPYKKPCFHFINENDNAPDFDFVENIV